MKRLAGGVICAVALMGSGLASSAHAADVPPPKSIDDAGVKAWLAEYIQAKDWTTIGADSEAVSLGSPEGVGQYASGRLQARVRHEYYRPVQLGSDAVRSLVQTLEIDCQVGTYRIVAMAIFSENNLEGRSTSREFADAAWSAAQPNSMKAREVERICRAPKEGRPQ